MSNATITLLAWLGVLLHLAVGIIRWRRLSPLPLMAALNAAVALCILAYWGQRWIGYLFRGVKWYLTDQLVPAYALIVLIVAGLALAGRPVSPVPQWLAFGVHAMVLLAGAVALFIPTIRLACGAVHDWATRHGADFSRE